MDWPSGPAADTLRPKVACAMTAVPVATVGVKQMPQRPDSVRKQIE